MRNTMRNPFSRLRLATAVLCCGCFGIATANAGTAGLAVTQLPAGVLMQNNPDAVPNWSYFSIANGEVVGFPPRSKSNLSTDRGIESASPIRRGELRDDGQLFLVDNSGGVFGDRHLTNGGALMLAGRLIDLQGSISASGRGNIKMTAGDGGHQGLLTSNDMRLLSAGTRISAEGRGETHMIAPAGYIHSESRTFNPFHRDDSAMVESFRRHAHATFLSAQHWNSENNRHDGRNRHGEVGEHHAGHHGGGPRWDFHDGYQYCEISPAIPEPRSYALMLAGLLVLWAVRRRWKNNASSDASA